MTVLEARGLSRCFGALRAVDGLDLTVGPGEIYAFLGLNGAGKTTSIRMLLGMIRPSAGTVSLFGVPVARHGSGPWSRVGHLVETPAAYGELTVRENLAVAARLHHLTDPRRAVDRAVERLGLGAHADRRADALSLGNRQRLGLARALLHEPRLLVLDEPANGLDPAGVLEIRELLRELAHAHGVAVFVSSHQLAEVDRLATRIGILRQGRLVEELDASALDSARPRWLRVDVRECDAARQVLRGAGYHTVSTPGGALRLDDPRAVAAPEQVARLLVGAGLSLIGLTTEQEDLETHFLQRVRDEEGAP